MTALDISSPVAVIGAGAMGAGIAQVAATAGHTVYVFDMSEDALDRGIGQISKFLARSVEKGKMDESEKDAILGRLHKVSTLADLKPAKLVIEAIVENLDVKRKVFGDLEDILSEDAILASNTSSLSITEIGATLKRPENLVGMHFFNPAPIMKLVEVIRGLATSNDVADTVFDTSVAWGKKTVFAKSTPGFIVNRVARSYYGEALRVAQEGGADYATIDACLREAGGFRMGPFELMDMIGNDVNFAVSNSVYNAYYQDPRFKPSLIQQEMVAAGRFGRKSGQGYYDYRDGAEKPEPATTESQPAPQKVTVLGDSLLMEPLVELAKEAGIDLVYEEESPEIGFRIGDLLVTPTNGATATEMTVLTGEPTVVFDLALDYKSCTRIAIAKADQLTDVALEAAAGFFQALGKKVSVLDDCPGLIVMRTVATLANEGGDAVYQGVATPDAVDTAMQFGVNYPKGPMIWAQEVGLSLIVEVLDSLAVFYGEDRYRVSPFLRRAVIAEKDIV